MDIAGEMLALDDKDRDFFDNLTEEERKKFSNFMMIRWGATVTGSADLQEYYLVSTNLRLNKHFFDIPSKEHAKLHWLLATTISPGIGKQYHKWISAPKKIAGGNKIRKFLEDCYPTAKSDEIDLLVKLNNTATVKQLAKELGMSPEQIKKDIA